MDNNRLHFCCFFSLSSAIFCRWSNSNVLVLNLWLRKIAFPREQLAVHVFWGPWLHTFLYSVGRNYMWVGFPRICWPLWATSLSLTFQTLLFSVVFLNYPWTFAGVLPCMSGICAFCMMCCLWSLFPFCNTHFSVDFSGTTSIASVSVFCFVFFFGGGCFCFLGGWSFNDAGYEPRALFLLSKDGLSC